MKQDPSSRPAHLSVQRQFEPNRLANDCQAQAYEHVLPVGGRSEFAGVLPRQTDGNQVEGELETSICEGVT